MFSMNLMTQACFSFFVFFNVAFFFPNTFLIANNPSVWTTLLATNSFIVSNFQDNVSANPIAHNIIYTSINNFINHPYSFTNFFITQLTQNPGMVILTMGASFWALSYIRNRNSIVSRNLINNRLIGFIYQNFPHLMRFVRFLFR